MKMRVNFISKSGQAQSLAMAISREYQCKSDSIPPAYPCENEKLVFIGFEFGSSEKVVSTFCKTLTPERAKNVAFFATSSSGDKSFDSLISILKSNGVNVVSENFQLKVKNGLFSKGKISPEDEKAAMDWAKKIVDSLTEN